MKGGGETQTAWVADYFDQSRKRHIKTFALKKEAEAWLAAARVDVKDGKHTPEHGSITIAQAAELWLQRCEAIGRAPRSLYVYRQYVKLFIATPLGE